MGRLLAVIAVVLSACSTTADVQPLEGELSRFRGLERVAIRAQVTTKGVERHLAAAEQYIIETAIKERAPQVKFVRESEAPEVLLQIFVLDHVVCTHCGGAERWWTWSVELRTSDVPPALAVAYGSKQKLFGKPFLQVGKQVGAVLARGGT